MKKLSLKKTQFTFIFLDKIYKANSNKRRRNNTSSICSI